MQMTLLRRAALGATFALAACITRPTDDWSPPPSPPGRTDESSGTKEPLSPFCRMMRPVIGEIRESIGPDVECMVLDHNETGFFGHQGDVMESSFLNACFGGLSRFESQIETRQKPLRNIATTLSTDLTVGPTGEIDLTEYGIVPARYQLHDVRGPIKASMTLALRSPAMTAVRDLGYTLDRLGRNAATPADVRESIQGCMTKLCGQETFYTSNIISARPEVMITLERGSASRLRPAGTNAAVRISHPSARSFLLMPDERLNLAAQISKSRDVMVGHDACEPNPPRQPPERRSKSDRTDGECTKVTHRNLATTLLGCGRSGGSTSRTVRCEFTIESPEYDRSVDLYVRDRDRSSSFIDDNGAPHYASWGRIANVESDRYAHSILVADVRTKLVIQYDNVPLSAKKVERLKLNVHADTFMAIEFRDFSLRSDTRFPSCQ